MLARVGGAAFTMLGGMYKLVPTTTEMIMEGSQLKKNGKHNYYMI